MDNINYKNNYLKQVIIRIDFRDYVETEKIFSESIEKNIRKAFPRQSIPQAVSFSDVSINIPPDNVALPQVTRELRTGISKEYISVDMMNKIILSNMALIVEVNQYVSYEAAINNINDVVKEIFKTNSIFTNRIGIRYINMFEQNAIKLNKGLFEKPISEIVACKDSKMIADKYALIRSMVQNEYHDGNSVLTMRYGFYNPDYPGILNKNDFVLDFDFYTEEQKDSFVDVAAFLEDGHDAIQKAFEASISDKLREKMHGE